jgi:hypothetical protein
MFQNDHQAMLMLPCTNICGRIVFYYDTARIFSKIPNCQDINDMG